MSYKEVIHKCSNCGWEMIAREKGMIITSYFNNSTGVFIADEMRTYICERCGSEI